MKKIIFIPLFALFLLSFLLFPALNSAKSHPEIPQKNAEEPLATLDIDGHIFQFYGDEIENMLRIYFMYENTRYSEANQRIFLDNDPNRGVFVDLNDEYQMYVQGTLKNPDYTLEIKKDQFIKNVNVYLVNNLDPMILRVKNTIGKYSLFCSLQASCTYRTGIEEEDFIKLTQNWTPVEVKNVKHSEYDLIFSLSNNDLTLSYGQIFLDSIEFYQLRSQEDLHIIKINYTTYKLTEDQYQDLITFLNPTE